MFNFYVYFLFIDNLIIIKLAVFIKLLINYKTKKTSIEKKLEKMSLMVCC